MHPVFTVESLERIQLLRQESRQLLRFWRVDINQLWRARFFLRLSESHGLKQILSCALPKRTSAAIAGTWLNLGFDGVPRRRDHFWKVRRRIAELLLTTLNEAAQWKELAYTLHTINGGCSVQNDEDYSVFLGNSEVAERGGFEPPLPFG